MSEQHTVVFVGINTAGSAIHDAFPQWMAMLDRTAELVSIDVPLGAPASSFRTIVADITADDTVLGAVITSHKRAVFDHARAKFNHVSEWSNTCGEISVISKRAGELCGTIIEPSSIAAVLRQFDDADPNDSASRDLALYGTGGSGTALLMCVTSPDWPASAQFATIRLVDTDRSRLARAQTLVEQRDPNARVTTHLATPRASLADIGPLAAGSLIVNATGLGKDAPGSPFDIPAPWPSRARVWDFNYRGDLHLLDAARGADPDLNVQAHDGWELFIQGWAESLEHVLDRPIAPEERNQMNDLALVVRR